MNPEFVKASHAENRVLPVADFVEVDIGFGADPIRVKQFEGLPVLTSFDCFPSSHATVDALKDGGTYFGWTIKPDERKNTAGVMTKGWAVTPPDRVSPPEGKVELWGHRLDDLLDSMWEAEPSRHELPQPV